MSKTMKLMEAVKKNLKEASNVKESNDINGFYSKLKDVIPGAEK